ncbi:hypothetical protein KZ940_32845, partial [Pseudomonas aeruginosa]|nr:hypothetical protein [Pseudomonas aeruginosa]
MSWQRLLGPLDRLPTEGSLEDWHAAALARADGLGTLERAVLGGRLAASPGPVPYTHLTPAAKRGG